MRNFKTYLIILFAIIIVILIFFLVKIINNNNYLSQNDKMISEINFIDSKLTSLLNEINNITLENYKITVTKTSTNSNSSSSSNEEDKTPEQYELEKKGVLTNNSEVNWDEIKNEIEILYTSIPVMTLDLYNMNISQEDILSFNRELDDLTVAVKNENKENTLIKLANLYRYLPAYASNFSKDLGYVSLLETKSNIFKSYVFVCINNWDEASSYLDKAIESYSRTLSNIQNNNYDTNKLYIILNEMKNAVLIKDTDIFLIKYKSFIAETEKLNTK